MLGAPRRAMTSSDLRTARYVSPHVAPMPADVRARVAELVARIPDEPEEQVHRDVTVELRALVGAESASSMLPLHVPELGWTVEYAYLYHPTLAIEDGRAFMNQVFAGIGRDELSPAFPMREELANRPLYCSREELATWGEYRYAEVARRATIPDPQIALALTERGTMLGYAGFGSFDDAFAPWAATVLSEVMPSLRARLAVDLRLREARVLGAALEAALELLEVPAFVLLASGHVVHANELGRLWRDRDPAGLRDAIEAGVRGDPDAVLACDRRHVRGMPDVIVAVQRRARSGARLARWAQDALLTRRETEVLEQVACGHANKTIAANLECSVKNVEAMITSILRKSGCASRTEILARLAAER